MRHLPFYGRWFRFLTFYPGAGLVDRALTASIPTTTTDGLAISETNRATRELFAALMLAAARRRRRARRRR